MYAVLFLSNDVSRTNFFESTQMIKNYWESMNFYIIALLAKPKHKPKRLRKSHNPIHRRFRSERRLIKGNIDFDS